FGLQIPPWGVRFPVRQFLRVRLRLSGRFALPVPQMPFLVPKLLVLRAVASLPFRFLALRYPEPVPATFPVRLVRASELWAWLAQTCWAPRVLLQQRSTA